MTSSTSKARPTEVPKPLTIVFGLDENEKPRAAWFAEDRRDLISKAAAAMNLKVCDASTPALAEVARKLPTGRLYANGRGFVPNVRGALYSALLAAAEAKQGTSLPRSRSEIGAGHLIIAQESLECGWWEAVVVARTGDILTVRFRDYPDCEAFRCHIDTIAMMHPPLD